MTTLQLKHDPYAVFRGRRTPAALYARQKWLQEATTAQWKADFDQTVRSLYQGPIQDGLWNNAPLATIQRLFGLHLTVRVADEVIETALNRLVGIIHDARPSDEDAAKTAEQLYGLPFAPGRWDVLLTSATLFLCAIFGKASDPSVLALYRQATATLAAGDLAEQDPTTLHNMLRALVVHPRFARHPVTNTMVGWLSARQTPQADWGPQIPFYQALNALAHLDTPEATTQCRRAFGRLTQKQHRDGTWGATDREWNTFLTVHALRNQGML